MTVFIRILEASDKEGALNDVLSKPDDRQFDVAIESFKKIPGSPFAYWVRPAVRDTFERVGPFLTRERVPSIGASTKNDFRYLRLFWEVAVDRMAFTQLETNYCKWVNFAKGGAFSPYYSEIYLLISWLHDGRELKADISEYRGRRGWGYQWSAALNGHDYYFRPGLTWSRRTNGLSFRAMPTGCIFADKGPAIIVEDDDADSMLALAGIINSCPFRYLVSVQLARTELAQSYEIGIIQQTPVPKPSVERCAELALRVRRAWSLKRLLDTANETSHAFTLPAPLLMRVAPKSFAPRVIEEELTLIQMEIDDVAYRLYGLDGEDRTVVEAWGRRAQSATPAIAADEPLSHESGEPEEDDVDQDGDDAADVQLSNNEASLTWAIGIAFGRFDIRLATGERPMPPEPAPFDPLPAKSPGMLPDGDPSFHPNLGILVDDTGHSCDLPRLIDAVLDRVGMDIALDTRAWLRRDFFLLHLKQYSKSRRKAPIYWPVATASGSYTLWLYYPALTDQTLFVAANDFVGTKLDHEVEPGLRALRQKTGRSREEERELEDLQTLHDELRALREELLRLASIWKPNHDDGVQITAAPLWRLFRHRPWQTVLRDTWEKLEAGEYDWAHLAMVYRPNQVREKCRTDKSLAIAHDLEHLYEPPPEAPGKAGRGRRKKG
jgi:hypothetical protein